MTGISVGDEGFVIEAQILADAFHLQAADVPLQMKDGKITSRCEKGVDADAGRWRLTFFHKDRALRLTVDAAGKILARASFDTLRPQR